ncbi:HAD family phosphatase [Patescibacteria group bacterium]|nr:MAG: HAD family phosphatase [Patescibacteria group bacterium]
MIRAILFDCFGVLVGQGFDATWRRAGGDPDQDRAFIADLLGATNVGVISLDEMTVQVCDKLQITPQQWAEVVAETERADQGLIDYIRDDLKSSYGVAVVSNASAGTLERVLTAEQRAVFDAQVVSAEVGHVKPDPEIYELAARKLGVAPSECVFTDDSLAYCQGAEAVGMQAIQFRDREQFVRDLEAILSHT